MCEKGQGEEDYPEILLWGPESENDITGIVIVYSPIQFKETRIANAKMNIIPRETHWNMREGK